MLPSYDKIPTELSLLNQWVLWKTIRRGDKPTKVPFQTNGKPASTSDPTTWASFNDASRAVKGYEGLGFVFSREDSFVGIDFDGCRNPTTGMLADWAKKWIARLNSYSEISPSETGVKVWVIGKSPMPSGKKIRPSGADVVTDKDPGLELYDFGRYFAVTGRRYSNLPAAPQERQKEIDELCAEFFFNGNGAARAEQQSSRLSTIERARKYLDAVPGAIEGQSGHNQTFKVACILILGFGLTKQESAPLLLEYNRRCEPRWTDRELQHKLDDADKQPGQRGYLRDAKDSAWPSIVVPEYAAPEQPPAKPVTKPRFQRIEESWYRLNIEDCGLTFDIDRIRREHNELIGELSVRCELAGVRTYDGSLSVADFNMSSARARSERARLLKDRSQMEGIDWAGFLEELCQRVIVAERTGDPSIDLRTLPKPDADEIIQIDRMNLPSRHPSILFGDGGSAKSYLGLYIAGELAQKGIRTAIFDWELAGEDHRDRLERIYNRIMMPHVEYVLCKHPLVDELDRLRKVVKDKGIQFAVYDSITFACDGPPESAETAARYFRAVRQIGCGSLHIAHITKSEFGDQKPFGSVFWHNGARATFFAKLVDESTAGNLVKIGIFNRKSNLGRIQRPTGYDIRFDRERTWFTVSDPSATPELAEKMPIRLRLLSLLKDGPIDADEAADTLGVEADSLKRTVRRYRGQFVVLSGGKVGILQHDTEADTLSADTPDTGGGHTPPL